MKVLVTGGCGFIGHHFVEHLYVKTDYDIIILDKLTYATKGFDCFQDSRCYNTNRVKIFTYDLMQPISEGLIKEIGNVNYIIHMAAETHIDNSIVNPVGVYMNNVSSTLNVLEYARKLKSLKLFFYFSTDEVYGYAPDNVAYKEEDRQRPTNPYSASKASGESLCLAYENTYSIPIIIVNCMNAFGERQHIEKFIPKVIKSILNDKEILIHSYPDCKRPGSRFYIHARNISGAVLFLMTNGKIGERYNIVGEKEVDNLEIVLLISKLINKKANYKLINFHKDRPGHDLRYALDGEKLHSMGWSCPITFEKSLEKTVKWTLEHKEWLEW